MSIDNDLKKEVLTRLLHAHPAGLGKEVLDNFRGEHAVVEVLRHLQQNGLIHDGNISESAGELALHYPIKLSSSGVETAKQLDA
ncbi:MULTISPECIES: hypothetical protein [unclassified Pseudomonas]|jgi:hypothetical protein|uniref:hypothetical protein n=1 Tax=unclassified Pseudomonas TaxID=196821 RepID=UPI0004831304|nr:MULTISPECIES: hypothetical protein [unclassified Pseudomonas]MBD9397735.1 hypothetical protein [Pseudomonas sp. PDM11]MBV7562788.1 hypothetical protein [Pseudomonas sp. sia0905]PZW71570.1 hypothetical protein F471_00644 [Pseudomonas sp. URMO17WK12:I1]